MDNKISEKIDIKEWYISNFEKFENNLNGNKEIPFHKIRQNAISRFAEMGFPTTRIEEWKYTSVAPLLQHQFSLEKPVSEIAPEILEKFTFAGLPANLLVFVNGEFRSDYSSVISQRKDLIIGNLKSALKENNALVEKYLSRYVDYQAEAFAALNTAFTLDGAFIYIPDNIILAEPIHILNIADPRGISYQAHPRTLIVVGNGSQVRLVESHRHISDHPYLHNQVTEILAGNDAIVDHVKIQDESREAYRIATTLVEQGKSSIFSSVNIDVGGALVRNNMDLRLNGERCESHLYGFYKVSGKQHVDNHTNISHLRPNCTSNEMFKGILSGKSRAVFSGTIFVAKDAQKTNAFQSNKNLLLSDEAEIDSKPQLKIFADDVKCSHGATIGQLDREALFYLRQRGISEAEANALLRYAFAADIFKNVKTEEVRNSVDRLVGERLKEDIE